MSQLVDGASDSSARSSSPPMDLWKFIRYFLKLGMIGFGGPVALVGFMNRDLVERRGWVKEDTYQLGLALAQIMPGPLAAQLAIALGYFQHGILGATLTGLAFVLPSFLMVVAISILYVAYGGLWWMQALFYGIGASVVAVIIIAAYKLARSTNKRDLLQWIIFCVLMAVTISIWRGWLDYLVAEKRITGFLSVRSGNSVIPSFVKYRDCADDGYLECGCAHAQFPHAREGENEIYRMAFALHDDVRGVHPRGSGGVHVQKPDGRAHVHVFH